MKGLDIFRNYFEAYADQYVLIGGAACDISFGENEVTFRATKDLDIALIIEAQTEEFGRKFWDFIKDGKYKNRVKNSGKAQFYRFDKPQEPDYPAMIELFSRSSWILEQNAVLTPIHIADAVSSLSAILLNDVYYEALLTGRTVIKGVSVLKPTWLVLFKAKAWLDLNGKVKEGIHVDSRDIKKHRNDILRIVSELVLEPCVLSETLKSDIMKFYKELQVSDTELKSLGLYDIHESDIKKVLADTYGL